MRHEARDDMTRRDEHEQSRECDVAESLTRLRDHALINSLQDPSLAWRKESTREHVSWESTIVDPSVPDPDPFNPGILNNQVNLLPGVSFLDKVFPRSVSNDWRTVETETLFAEGELYSISFRRTHIHSYMHHRSRGVNEISYTVEFVRRADLSKRVVVDDTKYAALRHLYPSIAARACKPSPHIS